MGSLKVSIEKSYTGGVDSAPFDLEVSFETHNELLVLFGPSGAGKTLTLDCIAGFTSPDKGNIQCGPEILFDSDDGINLDVHERRVGYVFQRDALFPHMTLRGNLEFAARANSRETRSGVVEKMLSQFGLESLAGRWPHQVSGGQRQRCSIARLLVSAPRLILLDEPARGLDVGLREQLYEVLSQVRAQYQLPMILVTHDLGEAFTLGGRMLVYERGRIIQDDLPTGVYTGPISPEVARLLGIAPVFEGVAVLNQGNDLVAIEANGLRFPVTQLEGYQHGQSVSFCLHTEHVAARLAEKPCSLSGLTLPLQNVIDMPTKVRLEFSNGVAAELPRQKMGVETATVGTLWNLEFPPGSVWVFPSQQSR